MKSVKEKGEIAASEKKRLRMMLRNMMILVIFMFAFSYLLVPMYNVLCKQFGINGKTQGQVQYHATASTVDLNRTVTVEFLTVNNGGLNWSFYPMVKKIKLHPGEVKRVAFYAANETDDEMTVQAIPSVSPGLAAKYLKKTECFCFTQQTLAAHEARDMPLIFHLDKDLPDEIHTLTLGYTLFDVSDRKKISNDNVGRIS